MRDLAVDCYVAGFLARCDGLRRPGHERVDQPGFHGLLSSSDAPPARMLVDNDAAHAAIVPLLAQGATGSTLHVLHGATACLRLVEDDAAWRGRPATAMIARDLTRMVGRAEPAGLTTRPVTRLFTDSADGVPLEHAVALAVRADPATTEGTAASLAAYLRSLPGSLRLFAAVDDAGTVRATSGVGVFGIHAHVLFVNTDPGWRGRGVGTAMTMLALQDARDRGAAAAHLDASEDGLPLYRRLGFEPVAPLTQFSKRA